MEKLEALISHCPFDQRLSSLGFLSILPSSLPNVAQFQLKDLEFNQIQLWYYQEENGDLVAELRDRLSKFQQHLMTELERISTTSRAYIFKATSNLFCLHSATPPTCLSPLQQNQSLLLHPIDLDLHPKRFLHQMGGVKLMLLISPN